MKIGILSCVFLVLFTLKLIGNITISWWWVTSPLWIPFIVYVLCYALFIQLMNWNRPKRK